MTAKLNFQQITIAYTGATFASVTTSLVGCYTLSKFGYDPDYGLVASMTWLATVGLPSLVVSGQTVKRVLGEKQPTRVTASPGPGTRRMIPLTANERTSNLFLSVLPFQQPLPAQIPAQQQPILPDRFTVSIDGTEYTVLLPELENFLYTAWKRQRRGDSGLSRVYWTKQHKPRLKTLEYNARMRVLDSVDGLILDREERRSGRLALPPMATLKTLETAF